jgi:hypothetical protein
MHEQPSVHRNSSQESAFTGDDMHIYTVCILTGTSVCSLTVRAQREERAARYIKRREVRLPNSEPLYLWQAQLRARVLHGRGSKLISAENVHSLVDTNIGQSKLLKDPIARSYATKLYMGE